MSMLSPTVLLEQVTVLVVDDEEPLRRYITRVMEDAGYHVLTARDGLEGLALLAQSRSPIRLVVTDVSMPRMTGPELAARVATQPHPPPVLFVSGDRGHTDLPGPLLGKPFLPHELSTLAHWVLHSRAEPCSAGPGAV